MRGSDDDRAIFAESNTNFIEGIFQMTASELPGSSWRILSYKKKYWEWIPAVMAVELAISSANSFSKWQILVVRFCTTVEETSCVLGVGYKSAFAVPFVFDLGGPTAPTGVERRSLGSPGPGSGNAGEVGLGLGLGLP